MKYYSVRFAISGTVPPGMSEESMRELLAALAGEAGFESFEEEDGVLVGYIRDNLLDRESLDAELACFPVPGIEVSYTVHETEDKDWNETWERDGFPPIYIGEKCVIHDTLHPVEVGDGEMEVLIDARQAFGTGCHETTRLMVNALLEDDLAGKRVLDCGCGTGILGIVAIKAGAREVVAYDIDEWSVENTRHNALLNGVEPIEVLTGDSKVLSHVTGLFDVVLANINRNILLQDMKEFKEVMASGGKLILSGFYESDIDQLVAEASSLRLSLSSSSSDGDWYSLTFST